MKKISIAIDSHFFDLLTTVFIVLKLIGIINWSWFWVLSPIIIPIGLILVIVLPITLFLAIFKGKKE